MKWLAPAAFSALLWLAASASAETQRSFIMSEAPKPVPEIQFVDGEGKTLTLANFHGRTVLFNIWATWCVPCRKEMPALDRLQAGLGGPEFEVVPLSIDRRGLEAVKKFYGEIGIQHVSQFVDTSNAASQALGIVGLPTNLLIDRQGQELARLIGPAEWDSPEMMAFLKPIITPPAEISPSAQQKETTS